MRQIVLVQAAQAQSSYPDAVFVGSWNVDAFQPHTELDDQLQAAGENSHRASDRSVAQSGRGAGPCSEQHLDALMRSRVSFAPSGTAMSADGRVSGSSSLLQVTTCATWDRIVAAVLL